MRKERMFPIQGEFDKDQRVRRMAGEVPWGVAELAYATYARWYGTGQTLERLAARGGFGWSELVGLLRADQEMPFVPAGKATEEV